ncbi:MULTISPECIES: BMP family protein [Sinorhizobium]|uniref:BMP family protein n=1 Tax=Sinorhizobium TaxID=28105 RepID=UPI000C9C1EDB|nr:MULTISPECIES: BMP family protein [Sinorhizobium]PND21785.1 BMP family ABC transporter substrate-binding protein [Ensifer sp. MMN_5]PND27138.1 BMP family ABC transporter substrate-binding protein [Sinorhizobium sp. M4_45]RVQ05319.1 BMP family ABC transporter substrate-binding protein [Sinorhizobium meliloti]
MMITRRGCLASAVAMAALIAAGPAFAGGASFKMGLLVPGSISEEGWNRIGFNALKGVEKELGAEVSYVELQQNPASFEKAFRDFASQGYNVILGHGFEFQDAALEVAPEYPDTVFLISSSYISEGNVIGLNTDTSQPFYLMGVIAAKTGKKAGLVGGMEIPPIKEAFEGFTNGVRSVAPDFPVSEVYIGNFTDATATKEASLSLISQGADFVLPNASGATVGGFQAAAESGADVKTFSIFSDYTSVAPKNILGLYVADYARGVIRIVGDIKNGKMPTTNVEFGLKDADVMSFTYNEQAANPVTEDVRKYVDEVKGKIAAGEIKTRQK